MTDEPSHIHWNGCGSKKNHLGSSQSVWKRPQSWRVAVSDHQIRGNIGLNLFRHDFIFLFTLISISALTLSNIKFGEPCISSSCKSDFYCPEMAFFQLISWHCMKWAIKAQIFVLRKDSAYIFGRKIWSEVWLSEKQTKINVISAYWSFKSPAEWVKERWSTLPSPIW